MRIDFPKEDIPEELVDFHYKSIMDFHMSYEKMRFDRDFSYIKYAGIFMLANLGMIFMDSVSAASNHNLWIMLFGIGLAFVLAMNMIFISAGIDAKCSLYLKEGISIEKKYQSLNNFHYFQASAEGRSAQYIASLFKRLLPFVVVGGMTIWADLLPKN